MATNKKKKKMKSPNNAKVVKEQQMNSLHEKLVRAGYDAGREHLRVAVCRALGIGPARWARVEEELVKELDGWDGADLALQIRTILNGEA